MLNPSFWQGKKVFITGVTGFKGSWLAIWLKKLGAEVHGYSLPPNTSPSCFALCGLDYHIPWTLGDIRNASYMAATMEDFSPEIVFHLAAQPIVRRSYLDPIETFEVNVTGTACVLSAIKHVATPKVVIVVTSDKVYENTVYTNGHKEGDRLGGEDPYSASKACAELVVDAYRASFFRDNKIRVATVRAGNVIGGGDWSEDRLIPDAVRAVTREDTLLVRNPKATRPWQHVIDPLSGYLLLAEKLWENKKWGSSWNFGPYANIEVPVSDLLTEFYKKWGKGKWRAEQTKTNLFEYQNLKLDCTLAYACLGWYQRISLDEALEMTVDWYKAHLAGENMLDITNKQIDRVCNID